MFKTITTDLPGGLLKNYNRSTWRDAHEVLGWKLLVWDFHYFPAWTLTEYSKRTHCFDEVEILVRYERYDKNICYM